MAETFEQVWRRVLHRCSLLPPLLARDIVQDAYRELIGRTRWGSQRGQADASIGAARTGTANVTVGSTAVAGVGIAFAATDRDRQIRLAASGGIPYSIDSVDVGANTCVLDRAWSGATATPATVEILDAYFTAPLDFAGFIAVLSITEHRQLRLWTTSDEINYYDPGRVVRGVPRAVVNRAPATTTSMLGRMQYEWWPYPSSAVVFPYYYFKTPSELADSATFVGPLRERTDVLVDFAMAKVANWPGTEERKNPYFNLGLGDRLTRIAEAKIALLEVDDQNIYMTWLETVGINQYPYTSLPVGGFGRDPREHE